jgi:DNA-binding SARP family transcriptional activator
MEFRILGPLEVLDGGRVLELSGQKQRALLAVLLLHANEVVSRDRLIEALWEEGPPETARKALQVLVSQLRKALGKERLETKASGYLLRLAEEELDILRFRRLLEEGRTTEALALWRGPPLSDFTYRQFAQAEIARLEERRLAAFEARFDADLAAGRHAELVGELEALVKEQPLRERLRAQLMLALYRSGRQAEALDVYQSARRALVEELGINPGRDVRDLHQAILNQDPGLDLPSDPQATPEPSRAVFVGRERELGELLAALDEALAGHGRLRLLVGEPGIGKSGLADELAMRARSRGVLALVGRCWEAGGAPAYWPWVQSLRGLIHATDSEHLPALLGGRGADLAQLMPELRELLPDLPEPPALDPESGRFRLFEAMTTLLKNAAEQRPLLLVLDDLHAADEPSLLLLRFVARELGASRMLVIGAYRDVDPKPGEALGAALSELAREPVTSILLLHGLSEAEVGRFIELTTAQIPATGVVEAVHGETEGNPLFVVEIVRLLTAEGRLAEAGARHVPQSLKEVIARRLRRLPSECKPVVSLAAVLGREFDLDVLATASALDRSLVFVLLDEAIAEQLVTDVPGSRTRLRFGHGLFREVLYDELAPGNRRELHRAVGEALEQLASDNGGSHLAELAHHFSEAVPAVDRSKAVDYARRAGDHAANLLAPEEAIRLYETALSLADDHERPQLLLRTARSMWIATGTGAERALEARDAFNAGSERDGAAEAELLLAEIRWAEGSHNLVWEHMRRATDLVRGRPISRTTADVLSHASRFHMLADEEEEAISTGREALTIAEQLGLESIRADCLSNIGVARASLGDLGGMNDLRQAFEIAVAVHDGWQIWRARVNLADILLWLVGDAERAFAEQHEVRRLLQTAGSGPVARWNHAYDAWELYWRGRWPEALQLCDDFVDWIEAGNRHYVAADLYCLRGLILASRGVEGARADTRAAVSLARRAKDPKNLYPAIAVHAQVATDFGEVDEAERALDELLSSMGPEPYPVYVVPLALAAIASGRSIDALARLERVRASPWRDAAMAMLRGDHVEAAERFATIGVQPEEAHARLLASEALAADGRDADANAQLAAGKRFFESVGAAAYTRRQIASD